MKPPDLPLSSGGDFGDLLGNYAVSILIVACESITRHSDRRMVFDIEVGERVSRIESVLHIVGDWMPYCRGFSNQIIIHIALPCLVKLSPAQMALVSPQL